MCKKALKTRRAASAQPAIDKYRKRGFDVYTPGEMPEEYKRKYTCGTPQCRCLGVMRELHDDLILFIPFEDEEFNILTEERVRAEWVLQLDLERAHLL